MNLYSAGSIYMLTGAVGMHMVMLCQCHSSCGINGS